MMILTNDCSSYSYRKGKFIMKKRNYVLLSVAVIHLIAQEQAYSTDFPDTSEWSSSNSNFQTYFSNAGITNYSGLASFDRDDIEKVFQNQTCVSILNALTSSNAKMNVLKQFRTFSSDLLEQADSLIEGVSKISSQIRILIKYSKRSSGAGQIDSMKSSGALTGLSLPEQAKAMDFKDAIPADSSVFGGFSTWKERERAITWYNASKVNRAMYISAKNDHILFGLPMQKDIESASKWYAVSRNKADWSKDIDLITGANSWASWSEKLTAMNKLKGVDAFILTQTSLNNYSDKDRLRRYLMSLPSLPSVSSALPGVESFHPSSIPSEVQSTFASANAATRKELQAWFSQGKSAFGYTNINHMKLADAVASSSLNDWGSALIEGLDSDGVTADQVRAVAAFADASVMSSYTTLSAKKAYVLSLIDMNAALSSKKLYGKLSDGSSVDKKDLINSLLLSGITALDINALTFSRIAIDSMTLNTTTVQRAKYIALHKLGVFGNLSNDGNARRQYLVTQMPSLSRVVRAGNAISTGVEVLANRLKRIQIADQLYEYGFMDNVSSSPSTLTDALFNDNRAAADFDASLKAFVSTSSEDASVRAARILLAHRVQQAGVYVSISDAGEKSSLVDSLYTAGKRYNTLNGSTVYDYISAATETGANRSKRILLIDSIISNSLDASLSGTVLNEKKALIDALRTANKEASDITSTLMDYVETGISETGSTRAARILLGDNIRANSLGSGDLKALITDLLSRGINASHIDSTVASYVNTGISDTASQRGLRIETASSVYSNSLAQSITNSGGVGEKVLVDALYSSSRTPAQITAIAAFKQLSNTDSGADRATYLGKIIDIDAALSSSMYADLSGDQITQKTDLIHALIARSASSISNVENFVSLSTQSGAARATYLGKVIDMHEVLNNNSSVFYASLSGTLNTQKKDLINDLISANKTSSNIESVVSYITPVETDSGAIRAQRVLLAYSIKAASLDSNITDGSSHKKALVDDLFAQNKRENNLSASSLTAYVDTSTPESGSTRATRILLVDVVNANSLGYNLSDADADAGKKALISAITAGGISSSDLSATVASYVDTVSESGANRGERILLAQKISSLSFGAGMTSGDEHKRALTNDLFTAGKRYGDMTSSLALHISSTEESGSNRALRVVLADSIKTLTTNAASKSEVVDLLFTAGKRSMSASDLADYIATTSESAQNRADRILLAQTAQANGFADNINDADTPTGKKALISALLTAQMSDSSVDAGLLTYASTAVAESGANRAKRMLLAHSIRSLSLATSISDTDGEKSLVADLLAAGKIYSDLSADLASYVSLGAETGANRAIRILLAENVLSNGLGTGMTTTGTEKSDLVDALFTDGKTASTLAGSNFSAYVSTSSESGSSRANRVLLAHAIYTNSLAASLSSGSAAVLVNTLRSGSFVASDIDSEFLLYITTSSESDANRAKRILLAKSLKTRSLADSISNSGGVGEKALVAGILNASKDASAITDTVASFVSAASEDGASRSARILLAFYINDKGFSNNISDAAQRKTLIDDLFSAGQRIDNVVLDALSYVDTTSESGALRAKRILLAQTVHTNSLAASIDDSTDGQKALVSALVGASLTSANVTGVLNYIATPSEHGSERGDRILLAYAIASQSFASGISDSGGVGEKALVSALKGHMIPSDIDNDVAAYINAAVTESGSARGARILLSDALRDQGLGVNLANSTQKKDLVAGLLSASKAYTDITSNLAAYVSTSSESGSDRSARVLLASAVYSNSLAVNLSSGTPKDLVDGLFTAGQTAAQMISIKDLVDTSAASVASMVSAIGSLWTYYNGAGVNLSTVLGLGSTSGEKRLALEAAYNGLFSGIYDTPSSLSTAVANYIAVSDRSAVLAITGVSSAADKRIAFDVAARGLFDGVNDAAIFASAKTIINNDTSGGMTYFANMISGATSAQARTALANAKEVYDANAAYLGGSSILGSSTGAQARTVLADAKTIIDLGSTYFSDILGGLGSSSDRQSYLASAAYMVASGVSLSELFAGLSTSGEKRGKLDSVKSITDLEGGAQYLSIISQSASSADLQTGLTNAKKLIGYLTAGVATNGTTYFTNLLSGLSSSVSGDGAIARAALVYAANVIDYDYSSPTTYELDNFFSGASGETARHAVRNASTVIDQSWGAVDYFENIMLDFSSASSARSALSNAYDILSSTSSSYFTVVLYNVTGGSARTALSNTKAIIDQSVNLDDLLNGLPSGSVQTGLLRAKTVIDNSTSHFADIMAATNSGITISNVTSDQGARRALMKAFYNANATGDLNALLDLSGTPLSGASLRSALNWYETTVSTVLNSAKFNALRQKGLDGTHTIGLFEGYTSSNMRALVDALSASPTMLSATDVTNLISSGSINWSNSAMASNATPSARAAYIYGLLPE